MSGASRALLLVDHGSRRAEANDQLETLADVVRSRLGEGGSVHAAHLEIAPPDVAAGIDRCVAEGAREVVIHPHFLAPGRHSSADIPRLVDEARARHPDVTFRVLGPLGLHPKLVDVVIERALGDD